MKKWTIALAAAAMSVSVAGMASAESDMVTITALNASKEAVEVEVPFDPQRVAMLDLASLDILDNLGLGERVVGSTTTTLDYLKKYEEDENIANLGTIKEADLEAVMACEPDVIFIGGRLSKSYDALSEIAPVVFLATDAELGVVQSTYNNAKTIASIFGVEDQVDEKFAGFDERVAALKEAAAGQTAVIGMATSGSFNILGNDGRCSIIAKEIGFENIGAAAASSNEHGNGGGKSEGSEQDKSAEKGTEKSTESAQESPAHGEETSFELIAELNPSHIFVLDRDSAIGQDGAQLAADIMDNELVKETDAYKNGKLIIMDTPSAWYTAEGGITALRNMLSDLETALIQ